MAVIAIKETSITINDEYTLLMVCIDPTLVTGSTDLEDTFDDAETNYLSGIGTMRIIDPLDDPNGCKDALGDKFWIILVWAARMKALELAWRIWLKIN